MSRVEEERGWSRWSSGRRCAGGISSTGSRSRSSPARPACRRNTVRKASARRSRRATRAAARRSKLDPFRDEIHRLLRADPTTAGPADPRADRRAGLRGRQDDPSTTTCARCARCSRRRAPSSAPSIGRARSASSTSGSRAREIPVGHGQTRRGYVVVACLGYSRAGAGALVFSKEAADSAAGASRRCLRALGALPETLVWDREGALHAGGGRPTEAFAAFCGQLRGRLAVLRARATRRRRASSSACRASCETSFEPGRSLRQRARLPDQLDRWFDERANARFHRDAPRRPDRAPGRGARRMRALPERLPDSDRRWVTRVPPEPYVRFDTNDYSLDPRSGRPAGRGPRLAARDRRGRARHAASSPAATGAASPRHRTITELEHARALRERASAAREPEVELRLARPLRRADPGMTRPPSSPPLPHAEGAAAARALPKLAERARAGGVELRALRRGAALDRGRLARVHGGEIRIKAARFPARKTLEEFDFTFQRSVKKQVIEHLGQLDFLHGRENVVTARPARHRQDAPGDRARDPRLPGRPARRVRDRDRVGRAARRGPAPRPPRRRARPPRADPAAGRRRGRLHPVRPRGRQPDVQLVSARYERASLIVTSNKPFSAWGEIFGDEVIAAAMIDRLVHHAEILSLKGDSYRLNDRDLGRPPAARTAETGLTDHPRRLRRGAAERLYAPRLERQRASSTPERHSRPAGPSPVPARPPGSPPRAQQIDKGVNIRPAQRGQLSTGLDMTSPSSRGVQSMA